MFAQVLARFVNVSAAPIGPADDAPTGRFGGLFSRKRKG